MRSNDSPADSPADSPSRGRARRRPVSLEELVVAQCGVVRHLTAVGRFEEAYHAVREYAETCYRHATTSANHPESARDELYRLTVWLADLGQAAGTVDDVGALAAELGRLPDHRFGTRVLHHLGLALTGLDGYLREVGARSRAQAVAQLVDPVAAGLAASAVGDPVPLRRLSIVDSERWLPALAGALLSGAERLEAAGHDDEALALYREGYFAYRRLADLDFGRYREPLTAAVTGYVERLDRLGLGHSAHPVLADALRWWRRLADTDPVGYRPALVGWLARLGAVSEPGEAIEIERERAALLAGTGAPLADALRWQGHLLLLTRQAAAATVVLGEAVRLWLAEPDPDPAQLAALADDLGELIDANIGDESRTAAMVDLVEVYRRLSDTDPDRWLIELAGALSSLHEQIDGYEDPQRVLSIAEETVRVLRLIDPAAGGNRTWMYPWALDDLAAGLRRTGRHAQALAAVTESIEVRILAARLDQRLVSPNGNPLLDVALSQRDRADDLAALGRVEEAVQAAREAVATCRQILADPTEAQRNGGLLAGVLRQATGYLRTGGHRAEAEDASRWFLRHDEEGVTLPQQTGHGVEPVVIVDHLGGNTVERTA